MKYWIYILKSIDHDKTYVGFTNDPERRIVEHNSGKSTYTNKFKPWKLVYKEAAADRLKARKRERYFKSSAGRKKIKIILNNNLPT